MSSILEMPEIKNKCQILTPISTVVTMLDIAGYNKHLFGKKILENSFGSGNILIEIVKRYICSCIKEKISKEKISIGLSEDIYGIELDKELFHKCKAALNKILQSYNLPSVKWKLYNKNALEWHSNIYFDYIIGNPPYITYKELDDKIRKSIKEKYDSCSDGKFDYYYAFIEMGIRYLNSTGKLVQLVPNNIYKNVFAHKLRNLLQKHISIIIDYPTQKIFKDVMTSSSIFVYDRTFTDNLITYKNETEKIELKISKYTLTGKWKFEKESKNDFDFNLVYFGEFFNASIVVATLLNEAFIVDDEIIDKYNIERKILRKAASPRSLRFGKEEKIIFPYFYKDNKLIRYRPVDFSEQYPFTEKYLNNFKSKLNARKKDKSVEWYEYGRTQALSHIHQEKLLLSTVVTNDVEIYQLDKATIPYSGIYITRKAIFPLACAQELLKSYDFKQYVKSIGINVNGKSIRITCKDINNFMFERRRLDLWKS